MGIPAIQTIYLNLRLSTSINYRLGWAVVIEFAVNSTSKRGRRTGFCGPVVVRFDAELEAWWGILHSDCAASSVWSSSRVECSSNATLWQPSIEISPTARVAMVTCGDARLPTLGKEETLDLDLSALPSHFCHPSRGLQPARRCAHAATAVEKNASSHSSDFRRESVRRV